MCARAPTSAAHLRARAPDARPRACSRAPTRACARTSMHSRTRSTICAGLCSHQPGRSSTWSCSSWCDATAVRVTSNRMKRELVVPWSMAPTYGPHGLAIAATAAATPSPSSRGGAVKATSAGRCTAPPPARARALAGPARGARPPRAVRMRRRGREAEGPCEGWPGRGARRAWLWRAREGGGERCPQRPAQRRPVPIFFFPARARTRSSAPPRSLAQSG